MKNELLESRMKAHGVRVTAMRLLILEALTNARDTLSLRELEDILYPADRSTIFRNLSLFEEHHLVHVIDDGTGTARYEACVSDFEHRHDDDRHVHFHCSHCGKTFCLTDIAVPTPALPEGYAAHSVNYVVSGLCPKCAGKHSLT